MKNNQDLAKGLVEKARHDLSFAEIGLQHEAPLDTIAFHLQQAAEKLIKALLASRNIVYPKTHDLDELIDLVPADLSDIQSFRERLIGWNSYAVEMRYEIGIYPEKEEIETAMQTAKDLSAAVQKVLNLS